MTKNELKQATIENSKIEVLYQEIMNPYFPENLKAFTEIMEKSEDWTAFANSVRNDERVKFSHAAGWMFPEDRALRMEFLEAVGAKNEVNHYRVKENPVRSEVPNLFTFIGLAENEDGGWFVFQDIKVLEEDAR